MLNRWAAQASGPVVRADETPQKTDQGKPKGVKGEQRALVQKQSETTQKAAPGPGAAEKPVLLAEQAERVVGENLVLQGSIGSHSLPLTINVYSIYSALYRLNLLLFLQEYAYF